MDGGLKTWLRAHPYPPFLEHLSFRLGNQLFFIRIEDVDRKVSGPGNSQGHVTAAKAANGIACIMPMKRKFLGGTWVPDIPGWGLLDATTRKPINPIELVSEQEIEMTEWEIHDMAVQVVRDHLAQEGFELMSWQGNPKVDPSIWFIGKTSKPEWVVVRPVVFPANSCERPNNWQDIAAGCAKSSNTGHFASVAIVSADQPFLSLDERPVPLWRGYRMRIRFSGLE